MDDRYRVEADLVVLLRSQDVAHAVASRNTTKELDVLLEMPHAISATAKVTTAVNAFLRLWQ